MAFENSGPTESAHQKYNSQVVSPAHQPQPDVCGLRTEWSVSHFYQAATPTSPASRGSTLMLIYTARSYDLYTHYPYSAPIAPESFAEGAQSVVLSLANRSLLLA